MREVRNVLVYVLRNHVRHGIQPLAIRPAGCAFEARALAAAGRNRRER